MASIRKRRGNWHVEVYVNGTRKAATFPTRREAQLWAGQKESALTASKADGIPDIPFSKLMERYDREISLHKRGHKREHNMINVFLRDPIAARSLRELSARDFSEWRDRRLSQVSAASVNREMTILSHACTIAKKEWEWLSSHPMADVRRPPPTAPRTRRPLEDEAERLLHTLGYVQGQDPVTQSARIGVAYLFAIETAIRAGEICSITWEHVHERHVHLPKTKNGHPRDVPLSKRARELIEQLRPVTESFDTVFGVKVALLDALFRKAREKAMVDGLHFHDTRREALTRLSKIYGVMELARISGHRDLRILQNVYYRPSIDDLADKLD